MLIEVIISIPTQITGQENLNGNRKISSAYTYQEAPFHAENNKYLE